MQSQPGFMDGAGTAILSTTVEHLEDLSLRNKLVGAQIAEIARLIGEARERNRTTFIEVNAAMAHLCALAEVQLPRASMQDITHIIDACRDQLLALSGASTNGSECAAVSSDTSIPVQKITILSQNESASGKNLEMVFASGLMQQVIHLVTKVAPTSRSVLITGERGTGKDLIARLIHQLGRGVRKKPMVSINCAGFSKELLESELFGYKKGAFTGAQQDHKGLIEEAAEGTIFLDEIGDMPMELQAKILRFLESGEYRRVGDSKVYESDARVVAATNQDLDALVREKKFREDLLDRLRFPIAMPPLRARADVPVLIDHVIGALQPAMELDREARALLLSYPFFGNVRELRNIIENAHILATGNGNTIGTHHIRPFLKRTEEQRSGEVIRS